MSWIRYLGIPLIMYIFAGVLAYRVLDIPKPSPEELQHVKGEVVTTAPGSMMLFETLAVVLAAACVISAIRVLPRHIRGDRR